MTNESNCPSQNDLKSYSVGDLSLDRFDEIADHLAGCRACQDSLVSVGDAATRDWPSFSRIRAGASPTVGCQKAIDDLRQAANMPRFWQMAIDADSGEPFEHRTLGPYQLLEKLDEGGMGVIYRGIHVESKVLVAVKVLPRATTGNTEAVRRFEREIHAVEKLNHPNIVRALDAGKIDGNHYLVMEFVDGIDLGTLSKRHGPLPICEACELIRQAACGLQAAHEQGMVHRDIKPSNLMLAIEPTGDEQAARAAVKILDLGLAMLDATSAPELRDLTATGQVMGTLDYMAPEQSEASRNVDIRADIYALGATLYKLLSGEVPFSPEKYDSPVKLISAIVNHDAPSIASKRDDLPNELATVVDRMLSRDPNKRFGTPRMVADAIASFAAGSDLAKLLEFNSGIPNKAAAATPTEVYKPSQSHDTTPDGDDVSRIHIQKNKSSLRRRLIVGLSSIALLFGLILLYADPRSNPFQESHETAVSEKESIVAPELLVDDQPAPTVFEVLTSDEWGWTEPTNLGRNINRSGDENGATLTPDGLTLIFQSERREGFGGRDLWVSRRADLNSPWEESQNLGATINSGGNDHYPCLCLGGNTIFFQRLQRSGAEIWVSSRAASDSAWSDPVHVMNGSHPAPTEDGLTLMFSDRDGATNEMTRESLEAPWVKKNSLDIGADDYACWISADARILLLMLFDRENNDACLNLMQRESKTSDWSAPIAIGPPVNGPDSEYSGTISSDGRSLVYSSFRKDGAGTEDLWISHRVPRSQTTENSKPNSPSSSERSSIPYYIPPGLKPGDFYQLVFVTSQTRDGKSSNIADYNSFVNQVADAAGIGLQNSENSPAGPIQWFAIVSTTSVAARDNAPVEAPIYNTLGNLIVNSAEELWGGSLRNPIAVTEVGGRSKPTYEIQDLKPELRTFTSVFTGTSTDGTPYPQKALGAVPPPEMNASYTYGDVDTTTSKWINSARHRASVNRPIYALSQKLTVPDVNRDSATSNELLP